MDLTGNGNTSALGEPEIAVNPVNPNDLFVDWTTIPLPFSFGGPIQVIPHLCGGLSSQNGGLSWQQAYLPSWACGDAVAAYGPDGTLYAGGTMTVSETSFFDIRSRDVVVRSTDGGQTWSAPVETMGFDSNNFVAGTVNTNVWDRPWLAVDQSTGVVYASGGSFPPPERRYVTASTDKGQTFGTIYPVDSSVYPGDPQAEGSTIAAANGVLAVAYVASPVAGGCTARCVIFETSTDYGATFTRHVVPTVGAAAAPSPYLAADPAGHGRFALTVFDAGGTQNQVYVTEDAGRTWQGPTVVAETPSNQQFKPWISYSPSGQIALVWRTWHGSPNTSPYDVWAAVGRAEGQNGAVFSAPMRVSSVAAAYPSVPPLAYPGFGDDFSWVVATDKYVHVGWGDSRDAAAPLNGGVQVWYGRIPINAFNGTREPEVQPHQYRPARSRTRSTTTPII
jgi:hypothetical protein